MTNGEVYKRCLDFAHDGKMPLSGVWFNEKHYRLEVVSYRPEQFWVDIDLLFQLGEMKDELRKGAINFYMEPITTMLFDFFYPAWDLNYYIKKGTRAIRAF